MGDVGRKGLSALPACNGLRDCGQILPNNEQMGLAATCAAQANRGWTLADESLESEGKPLCLRSVHTGFLTSVVDLSRR